MRKGNKYWMAVICMCALAMAGCEKDNKTMEIKNVTTNRTEKSFYSLEFDEMSPIFSRIKGKSYKDNCTLPLSDLRYLHIMYVGFDGKDHTGEIICNAYIADDLLYIFKELYENRYQLECIELVDNYDANDEESMRANNTSCFNYRYVSFTTLVSKHGLGMAIDINPLYNPYVKEVEGQMSVEPLTGAAYVDRTKDFPHKIDENDLAYKLFTERGFFWGGHWNDSKDYQHFEITTDVINRLYPN